MRQTAAAASWEISVEGVPEIHPYTAPLVVDVAP